ncbi:hypothetical protein ABMA10_19835 [Plantibacter sp. RU18]
MPSGTGRYPITDSSNAHLTRMRPIPFTRTRLAVTASQHQRPSTPRTVSDQVGPIRPVIGQREPGSGEGLRDHLADPRPVDGDGFGSSESKPERYTVGDPDRTTTRPRRVRHGPGQHEGFIAPKLVRNDGLEMRERSVAHRHLTRVVVQKPHSPSPFTSTSPTCTSTRRRLGRMTRRAAAEDTVGSPCLAPRGPSIEQNAEPTSTFSTGFSTRGRGTVRTTRRLSQVEDGLNREFGRDRIPALHCFQQPRISVLEPIPVR